MRNVRPRRGEGGLDKFFPAPEEDEHTKPLLTAWELQVLMQTARESLSFSDRGMVFSFTEAERTRVVGACADYLGEIGIGVVR